MGADRATLRTYLQDVTGLGNDATGLDQAKPTIDEAFTAMDDFDELNTNKGVKSLATNVRKP